MRSLGLFIQPGASYTGYLLQGIGPLLGNAIVVTVGGARMEPLCFGEWIGLLLPLRGV